MLANFPSSYPDRPLSRSNVVLALYGALSLLGLLIAGYRGEPNVYLRAANSSLFMLVLSPLMGLTVGLMVVCLSRIAVDRFHWARQLHTEFRAILGPLTHSEILILAAASSVGEEILFRGALLPALGLWAQALIFALLHIGPGKQFLAWTAWAFVMGILFGLLMTVTGNLGGSIAAHFIINYLNLSFIAKVDLAQEKTSEDDSPPTETSSSPRAA